MKFGETVYFIGGHNIGKKGRYIGHYRDGGYFVPHIYMDQEDQYSQYANIEMAKSEIEGVGMTACNVARPWDREIVTENGLRDEIDVLESEIDFAKERVSEKKKILSEIGS